MSKGKRQQPIPQPRHQPLKNNAWDELNDLSNETTAVLHTAIGGAREAVLSAQQVSIDPVERSQLTSLIGRDAKKLTDRLTTLRDTHKDRKGSAKDGDDLVITLNVGSQYSDLISDTGHTLLNHTARLTELVAAAESPESAQPAPEPSNIEA